MSGTDAELRALAALAELEKLATHRIPLWERNRIAATAWDAGKRIIFRRVPPGIVQVEFWDGYKRAPGVPMMQVCNVPPYVQERAARLLNRTPAEDAR